jgi:nitrate reductase gamma subunit
MSALQLLTYISYAFIIIIYTWRTAKYARMPLHLRWDLYPMPGEKKHSYGGSYFEELEWWKKRPKTSTLPKIVFLLKDYISFVQYFKRNRGYWLVLYPWHIGFYLIFISHILFFAGGLALVFNFPISAGSANIFSMAIYYMTLISSVGGCAAGCIGSIGILIKRITDKDLSAYSTPMYIFNYVFFLLVFLSGLVSWYFFDPTLTSFREFWRSLISFSAADVDLATGMHVILFSLFLIYMPFTRAMHYITKFFMFFSVRWDDTTNMQDTNVEQKLQQHFNRRVSWSAPHVQSGKTWTEVINGAQHSDK